MYFSKHYKTGHICLLKLCVIALMSLAVSAHGQVVSDNIPELKRIDIIEHSGESIPLNLHFTDENGNMRKLSEFFNRQKPVILTLAYYNCPMLCTFVLNGMVDGLKNLDWKLGEEYQLITVSIDPTESSNLSAAKKKNYFSSLNKKGSEEGWKFFTGKQDQIKSLADAVGFKYYYDEEKKQYAHAAALFVLTEEGKISRYLYGVNFKPNDLKLSLLEASQGKIGNTIDHLLLYCFQYDPNAKGYVLFAGNVMRLGGILTMIILGAVLFLLWRKERRTKYDIQLAKEQ